ncbi:MAG: hypothetical protein O7F08_05025 [Deltaproteobacteria bacterium]|nr:hypothetical protein [Deltaproteobacteria bacterium]
MRMLRLERLGAIVLLVALISACGDSGGGATIEVSLADLPCQMQNVAGIWESAPLPPITDEQCMWFPFEANTTYIFEHPLGRVPSVIIGYLAFGSDGTSATIGSGNVFLINGADDSTVTVRNGQNQHFWLRLVLE